MKTSGNTILITGGATGIGLALAEQFVKLGNQVIICGRRESRLKEASAKLGKVPFRVCDVTDTDERIKLFEWSVRSFPSLNILVNNAGIQHSYNLLQPLDTDLVRSECETNFVAPVHLSTLFATHLKDMENAAIINITSGLAFTPLAFMSVYCATKAALHSFSLSLRHQLSGTNVKVFEIAPPTVDTELDRGERDNRANSHRGIKPVEFAIEAVEAFRNDKYEAAVGTAENLRTRREDMFGMLNH
ncbi:MAG: SDR family NAD(P)-dependent oxidoreductase [Bacteroidales bacterium]|jgi:uncharacterized oxidoreductase